MKLFKGVVIGMGALLCLSLRRAESEGRRLG